MPEVFHATLIGVELIGPKVRPIWRSRWTTGQNSCIELFLTNYIHARKRTERSHQGGTKRNIQSAVKAGSNNEQVLTSKSVDMFM